jgi:hypothetical protein
MATQGISTIGIDVSVNSVSLNYVQEIGDMGGAPSELDATCLKDGIKKQVPGVQENKAWECTYLFDNTDEDSDYRLLRGLQEERQVVPVKVTFPDGTVFASTGYVSTYLSGAKVDELVTAKLLIHTQSAWTVTNPTA